MIADAMCAVSVLAAPTLKLIVTGSRAASAARIPFVSDINFEPAGLTAMFSGLSAGASEASATNCEISESSSPRRGSLAGSSDAAVERTVSRLSSFDTSTPRSA
jgi:hypothetical protein